MLLAFGSLVAAGLPLMLTMVGLLAAAGSLYLGTLIMPISIWAMNFALMFALALGIDYALFIVHALPRRVLRLEARPPTEAAAVTMDTAGKAVLFSGVTVLISLTAVMLVPSPAFRSHEPRDHARRDLRARRDADAAARGAREARPEGRQARAAVGALRRAPLAALRRLGRAAVAPSLRATARSRSRCSSRSRCPVTQLKTSMPSIKVVPSGDSSRVGYDQVAGRDRARRDRPAAARRARRPGRRGRARSPGAIRASPQVLPAQPGSGGLALVTAIPRQDPSNPAVGATIDRLRAELPAGTVLGGAVAENHDLQHAARRPRRRS